MKNLKMSAVLTISAAALALTGCSLTEGSTGESASGTNAPSGEMAGVEEEAAAAPSTTKFGQTYTWDDGLSVKFTKPQTYTMTEDQSDIGITSDQFVSMQVTIVNKTGQPFDPTLAGESVQSGNTEGEWVMAEGFDGPPMTTLLDGREATYGVVYGVSDPADIVLEFNPGTMVHESAIFTTKGS